MPASATSSVSAMNVDLEVYWYWLAIKAERLSAMAVKKINITSTEIINDPCCFTVNGFSGSGFEACWCAARGLFIAEDHPGMVANLNRLGGRRVL